MNYANARASHSFLLTRPVSTHVPRRCHRPETHGSSTGFSRGPSFSATEAHQSTRSQASFMVKLRTPRRSLCFSPPVALSSSVSSISKFRGAIPKVEGWLPSRPKHLDPCGVASVACSSLWITLTTAISEAGVKTLKAALQAVRERQVEIIPIWTVSHNAAEAIAHAAKELDVDTVLIGRAAVRPSTICFAAMRSKGRRRNFREIAI